MEYIILDNCIFYIALKLMGVFSWPMPMMVRGYNLKGHGFANCYIYGYVIGFRDELGVDTK